MSVRRYEKEVCFMNGRWEKEEGAKADGRERQYEADYGLLCNRTGQHRYRSARKRNRKERYGTGRYTGRRSVGDVEVLVDEQAYAQRDLLLSSEMARVSVNQRVALRGELY